MNWRQLSTARRMDIVCQAQIEGRSARELAARLGVSHQAIVKFALKYGVPFGRARDRARRAERTHYTEHSGDDILPWRLRNYAERMDTMVRELRRGNSLRTIASLVGAQSVRQIYVFHGQNKDEIRRRLSLPVDAAGGTGRASRSLLPRLNLPPEVATDRQSA